MEKFLKKLQKMKFKNITEVTSTQLANIVSNDSLRPTMTGVFIDSEFSVIAGTNSHLLMTYPIEIISDEKISKIVPIEFFNIKKYAGKITPKDIQFLEYSLEEDYAKVYYREKLIFLCSYIAEDSKYPNYRAVIPTGGKTEIGEIGVSLKFLKNISDSLPGTFSQKSGTLSFYGQNRAIKLVFNSDDLQIVGILMPYMGV